MGRSRDREGLVLGLTWGLGIGLEHSENSRLLVSSISLISLSLRRASGGIGGILEGFGGILEGFGGILEGFGGISEGFGGISEGFGGIWRDLEGFWRDLEGLSNA